jgi:predicted Na+-dependent transporter
MPTTLTSGVILTRIANGNVALALLLTVVASLLAVVTVPFVLDYVRAESRNVLIYHGIVFHL